MTKEKIVSLLRELNNDIPEEASVNLLGEGYIDSFDIANIVVALEENFHIEIPAEAIVAENFESAAAIWAMVQELQQ